MRLKLDDVSVLRGATRVLDQASFAAERGEFIGVIGPNGAGKTSLLRLIAGVEAPAQGAARLDNIPITDLPPRARARRIAYLPQARPLYAAISVEALVALGRFAYGSTTALDARGRAAVESAMAATKITVLRERTAASLSGGEFARAHLARALAAEAELLVADEPIAALDPKHQVQTLDILAAKAATGGLVVAALHELALARLYCSRLLLLDQGRIVADGPPQDVLTLERLNAVFRLNAETSAYFVRAEKQI